MNEPTTHGSWTEQLDAYLDGELDSARTVDLDRHLRECSACAAEGLRRLQWKRAIHSASQRYAADPSLRDRIHKSIAPRRMTWWQWRPAFALAAAVLLLIASARIFEQQVLRPKQPVVQEARLTSELADLHIATLASTNPVDVVSSDRHNVKPWFAGKIPFTFNLPELQGTPFELVGGRVSYLEQSPGAQLLYGVRKHQISVFIFPVRTLPRDLAASGDNDARSFHMESWQRNGLQYFAISDVAPDDLRALSELFKK